jgi:hypothetical protein
MFLCSYIKKGISRTETVVNLHEFLVKDYDLTSPISQQGTNAQKTLFKIRILHAKNELTLMVSLNSSDYSSDNRETRFILSLLLLLIF